MLKLATFIWLCFSAAQLFAKSVTSSLSQDEVFKPNQYHNYLTCLALCGNLHTKRVNRTLLSGEQVTDWIKDELFDGCDNFCQMREKYPAASRLESLAPTDFDRLEVTCLERESLAPFKIRAKLNIPHQDDFPVNESILFVVETWRSIAEEGGVIKNSLAGRYFTFSSQFMTPYKFSQNPNRENFYVRIFPFTADGSIGKPMCSGAVAPRSLLNALHRPLTLGNAQPTQIRINSTSHFLQWTAGDELAPPECDQFVQLIMAQKIQTKTVNLDTSHVVPIGELNENFTYQIKMSGSLAHQANADSDSTSVIIIGALNDVDSEDWNAKLDRYFGLLIMVCLISLMLIISICFFCCRPRRQKHLVHTPNAIHPQQNGQQTENKSQMSRDGQNEDTKTEDTSIVVEQPSFVDTRYIPYELNYSAHGKELSNCHDFGFQARDEGCRALGQPHQIRSLFGPNNATSMPNAGVPLFLPLTPPSEDFV